LEGGETAPELRELILNRAAGNPFFMEELTHSLLENGSIEKKDGSFVLARDKSGVQVPDTVQGIIAARMDRLEESLKRIIQVAAVIGREFAFRILETISDMKEELKSGLLNLQGLEFIYEKGLFPELEYIFKHALTQEVAYNSLLLQRRKEIHERIGNAIEKLYPHRLEEFYEMLAWHYSHSNNQVKACQFLKLSGQKATRSSSIREAFRIFKKALEMLHHMPQTTDNDNNRLEVLRLMTAVPMRALGFPEGSIEFLSEGEALARKLGDGKALVSFINNTGFYYMMAGGDPALGKTYMQKGLSALERIGDVQTIAPMFFDFVGSCTITGNFGEICEVVPKCIELIEKVPNQSETFGGHHSIYSLLKAAHGCAMGAMGNFDMGERILEDCRKFARQIRNPSTLAFIEMYQGDFYLYKGDGKRTIEHYRTAAELCERGQVVSFTGIARAGMGYGYLLLEQPTTALEHLEKGLGIHSGLGMPLWLGSIHAYLGVAHLQLGNLEKAKAYAEQGVNLSRANKERGAEALAEMFLGRILAADNPSRSDEAKEHIFRSIEIADELKLKPITAVGYFHLGELSGSSSPTTEAVAQLQKAEAMFREMGMDDWLAKAQKALAKL
jgi:tetratricopeptide (TPR) repeat protein